MALYAPSPHDFLKFARILEVLAEPKVIKQALKTVEPELKALAAERAKLEEVSAAAEARLQEASKAEKALREERSALDRDKRDFAGQCKDFERKMNRETIALANDRDRFEAERRDFDDLADQTKEELRARAEAVSRREEEAQKALEEVQRTRAEIDEFKRRMAGE